MILLKFDNNFKYLISKSFYSYTKQEKIVFSKIEFAYKLSFFLKKFCFCFSSFFFFAKNINTVHSKIITVQLYNFIMYF